jgi:hypothetical protein
MMDFINDAPKWFFIVMLGMLCTVGVFAVVMVVILVLAMNRGPRSRGEDRDR